MKIGLPSDGNDLSDSFALQFGRCNYFIVYDAENQKIVSASVNTAKNAAGGAGIQAAQSLIDNQVEVVIAPQVGPNAWNVLEGAGIKIYTGIEGTLQQNIDEFNKGNLNEMKGASGFGRGMGRGSGRGMGRGMGRNRR